MVYAGLATFVPEADIWKGKLEPGALLQVWSSREEFNLMRAGRIKEKGKWRRLNDTDGIFFGTSMVFVAYGPGNKGIIVRHFGRTEPKSKSSFEVWIAANPITPDAQLEPK
jgi:hypothetical protein